MELNKILSADLLDLIFENRNKDYGAYLLRKTYHKRILHALMITASVALLAFLGSMIANKINNGAKKQRGPEVNLQNIQPIEEKKVIPPPPVQKQEPPKLEMKQFTPPKVVKDEEVQKPPPEQDELKDAKIDVQDREGIKDQNIATPTDLDEGKKIIEEKKDDGAPFEKVEIEALFKGDWKRFLEKNLNPNVPSDNNAPAGTYTVVVQFVVDIEGNISDVKAISNPGYGMGEEAIRVIKKAPNWEPAVQNGRKVKAYRRQPITFLVQE